MMYKEKNIQENNIQGNKTKEETENLKKKLDEKVKKGERYV